MHELICLKFFYLIILSFFYLCIVFFITKYIFEINHNYDYLDIILEYFLSYKFIDFINIYIKVKNIIFYDH